MNRIILTHSLICPSVCLSVRGSGGGAAAGRGDRSAGCAAQVDDAALLRHEPQRAAEGPGVPAQVLQHAGARGVPSAGV